MSKTTKWAIDKLPKAAGDAAQEYYRAFNEIYYKHRKPTADDVRILNLSMERLLELRKDGYAFENHSRNDALNYADFKDAEEMQRVTNRQRRKQNDGTDE